jgi:hypothetical protein
MMPDRQLAMNSDIQPVRLSQLPELTEEFFGLVFRDNRLSYGGLWRGSDVARLQLDGPLEQLEDLFIDRETFGNIFSFRSPAGDQFPPRNWRETDPVIAQRITFTGNPLVSTLFALGEREQCLDLIEARYYAMKQAMTLVQRLAVLESESNLPLLRRGCLYAAFLAGAAPDQTPRLETTILIAQQYRLPDGKEVHFPLTLAPGALSELIARSEWSKLSEIVGTFGLTERTRVPENLFTPPSMRDLGLTEKPLPGSVTDRRLAGRELFVAWRNQAAAKGWGPEQVKDLFAAGQLLSKAVRWEHNLRVTEGIAAVYHAVARTGSRLSTPLPEKDRGHGPSL